MERIPISAVLQATSEKQMPMGDAPSKDQADTDSSGQIVSEADEGKPYCIFSKRKKTIKSNPRPCTKRQDPADEPSPDHPITPLVSEEDLHSLKMLATVASEEQKEVSKEIPVSLPRSPEFSLPENVGSKVKSQSLNEHTKAIDVVPELVPGDTRSMGETRGIVTEVAKPIDRHSESVLDDTKSNNDIPLNDLPSSGCSSTCGQEKLPEDSLKSQLKALDYSKNSESLIVLSNSTETSDLKTNKDTGNSILFPELDKNMEENCTTMLIINAAARCGGYVIDTPSRPSTPIFPCISEPPTTKDANNPEVLPFKKLDMLDLNKVSLVKLFSDFEFWVRRGMDKTSNRRESADFIGYVREELADVLDIFEKMIARVHSLKTCACLLPDPSCFSRHGYIGQKSSIQQELIDSAYTALKKLKAMKADAAVDYKEVKEMGSCELEEKQRVAKASSIIYNSYIKMAENIVDLSSSVHDLHIKVRDFVWEMDKLL